MSDELFALLEKVSLWEIYRRIWLEARRKAKEQGAHTTVESRQAMARLDAIAKEITNDVHNDAVLDAFLMMRDSIKQTDEELKKLRPLKADYDHALDLLDKAGVWTGADDIVSDRVQYLLIIHDGDGK